MTNWTKDNIPNLRGKIVIITGANSGLGYESSLALAEKAQWSSWLVATLNEHSARWRQSSTRCPMPNWN